MLRAAPGWRDKPGFFEREQHLVDGGRGDLEEALHVGLGRRAAVDQRIGVDKREILALLGREIRSGITGILIHRCPRQ